MNNFKHLLCTFILSLTPLAVTVAPQASVATKTWTGTAGDHKFSTAGNWNPAGAPTNGDGLVFTFYDGIDWKADNDLVDLSVAGITFNGSSGKGNMGFTISGDALTLTGDIVDATTNEDFINVISSAITLSGNSKVAVPAIPVAGGRQDHDLYLAVISGPGKLTKLGEGILHLYEDNRGYHGPITVSAGTLEVRNSNGLGNNSAGTTVNNGATLLLCITKDYYTVTEPMTIGGTGVRDGGALVVAPCAGVRGLPQSTQGAATLSGDTTLTADTVFSGNIKLTGVLSGSYHVIPADGSSITIQASKNTSLTPNTSSPPMANGRPGGSKPGWSGWIVATVIVLAAAAVVLLTARRKHRLGLWRRRSR